MMRALGLMPLALAIATAPLRAAPPEGVRPDPEIAAWYRSLRDARGLSCCDEADCRPVPYRANGGGIEVFIGRSTFGAGAPEAWLRVPPEAILVRENPTGAAVACFFGGRVACFVRPMEG